MRDHTENNLLTTTFLEMKCKIIFPNSVLPRYGFLQIVKKGEQDLICLGDRDFFISVRGRSISHCCIENEAKTNLFYTEANVIQFYSRAETSSEQANTLEQFAYDYFVKDTMPYALMAQKVSSIKIGIQFETQKRNLYTEATDFHMADLYIKSEIEILATYKKHVAIKKKKHEMAQETRVTVRKTTTEEYVFEDVLDTSKYDHHDEYLQTGDGINW